MLAQPIARSVQPIRLRPHAADRGWPTYGGDLANTRYSPLDQITAANFSELDVAWRFKTDNFGPSPEYVLQSTPLVVNGVLYSTAGSRRAVVALDASNGELLWMYREDEGERGANAPRRQSGRGLAYWSSGGESRIVYVTPGYRMIALDAKTGHRVPGFGQNGVVDLKTDFDQTIDLIKSDVGLAATPIIANDVIVVGAAHGVGTAPPRMENVKGYVRGFDARTGKRLWTFHTIPRKGEFGYETWHNDSAVRAGNAGAWTQTAVDAELSTAYLPIELPSGDFYGGHRPGAGLFGESLVAVDLRTGRRKWHYQLVHHGLWDSDVGSPPILADIVVSGRAIKAVVQPTKQGFLFVFDRVTGEPVWPIEERPVPQGDVPGEVVLADTTVPNEARGFRAAGRVGGRPDRLHAGAARRGARLHPQLPDWTTVHAAVDGGSERHVWNVDAAEQPGRRELARRFGTIQKRRCCTYSRKPSLRRSALCREIQRRPTFLFPGAWEAVRRERAGPRPSEAPARDGPRAAARNRRQRAWRRVEAVAAPD